VEDAVCVCGGVACVGCGGVLWHGKSGGDCILAATFFCQIVFGIYAMILESRRSKQRSEVVNA